MADTFDNLLANLAASADDSAGEPPYYGYYVLVKDGIPVSEECCDEGHDSVIEARMHARQLGEEAGPQDSPFQRFDPRGL